MTNLFRNKYLLGLGLLFLILAIPSLLLGWSLVDDGKSAQVAYELTEAAQKLDGQRFLNNFLEPDSGRFRPGYWIYLWVTFLIGGSNAFIHHTIHLLLLAASMYMVYLLGRSISKRTSVGVLAATLFLVDWRILENWYRLGTQEPITLPLLLLSLYIFLKSRETVDVTKLLISLLLAIFALLVKETNIAYIGIPAYLLVADLIAKNKKYIKFDLIYLITVVIASIGIRMLSSSVYGMEGYASLYEISRESILNNLTNYTTMIRSGYSPLLEFALIALLLRIAFTFSSKKLPGLLKDYYWHGLWIAWFISFFVIQIPWGFTIGRYLLIALVGLHIIIADAFVLSLDFINSFLRLKEIKNRLDFNISFKLLKTSLIVLLPLVLFYHLFMAVNYIYWVSGIDKFNSSFIETLVKETPRNGRVFLNAEYLVSPPVELYYETDWHFDYLFNRKDITYDYLKDDIGIVSGDIIAIHTAAPMREESEFQNGNYRLVAESKLDASNMVLTSPLSIIKTTMKGTISGFGGLGSSIVATSVNKYRWVIYQAK